LSEEALSEHFSRISDHSVYGFNRHALPRGDTAHLSLSLDHSVCGRFCGRGCKRRRFRSDRHLADFLDDIKKAKQLPSEVAENLPVGVVAYANELKDIVMGMSCSVMKRWKI
jgi:hypothetical protein